MPKSADPVYDLDLDASPDGAQQAPPRMRSRRSASKPRRSSRTAPADTYDAEGTLEHLANSIAAMRGFDDANLDLVCEVQGVSHRGTVKFRVMHVEQLTASMLDRWRLLCSSRGYVPRVSVNTATSEVTIQCTPLAASAGGILVACKRFAAKLHPLTWCFWVLLALNVLRRAY